MESSIGVSEYFFLTHLCDPDIIILSPLLLVSVVNESEVMTTVSFSIMDNDRMQVVRSFVHMLVSLFNLSIELSDLFLHVVKLVVNHREVML